VTRVLAGVCTYMFRSFEQRRIFPSNALINIWVPAPVQTGCWGKANAKCRTTYLISRPPPAIWAPRVSAGRAAAIIPIHHAGHLCTRVSVGLLICGWCRRRSFSLSVPLHMCSVQCMDVPTAEAWRRMFVQPEHRMESLFPIHLISQCDLDFMQPICVFI